MSHSVTEQPKTMSIPEAGWKYFKLKPAASYAAARRGDIPTIRVGRILRTPIAAMEQKLENVGLRPCSSVQTA